MLVHESNRFAAQILKKERLLRESQFATLSAQGIVRGEFSRGPWIYQGDTLNFWCRRKHGDDKVPLAGATNDVARCYALKAILGGESASGVRGRIAPIRWLAELTGDGADGWSAISSKKLDKCVELMSQGYGANSTYSRACGLGQLIDYFNSTIHRYNGKQTGFLPQRLKWRIKLKNPVVSTLNRLSPEGKRHTAQHYKPNLHYALGQARATVKQDPTIEPTPGHDLIRLEALAFAMSMGIRVWETCSLPRTAYDVEATTGMPFVRVIAEKGAIPAARPVESVWAPLLAEAYDYLLEQCAPARARAKQIERSGFSFLKEELLVPRILKPLSSIDKLRLKLSGLSESNYFFVREVVDAFDIPPNEMTTTGRNLATTRHVVAVGEARLVEWIDKRFSNWDWPQVARQFKGAGVRGPDEPELTLTRLSMLSGIAKQNILKHPLREKIKELLSSLATNGLLLLNGKVSDSAKDRVQKLWLRLRQQLLIPRKGSERVVDISAWAVVLEQRYRNYLGKHFRENFASKKDGVPVQVKSTRRSSANVGEGLLSEQLIVLWDYQFTGFRNKGVIPRPMLRHDLYNYLCGDKLKETIFKRLNIRDESGKHVAITPHDIRHWVTTAKNRSGPSQMMVDLWMGRKPGQSRRYDHRTSAERAEAVRSLYTTRVLPDDHLGRKVASWRASMIDEDEIALMISSKLRVAHFVPWGMCSRELYVTPCSRGLMCLRGFGGEGACESFHVDPGDLDAKANIESLKKKYLAMLRTIEPNYDAMRSQMIGELNDAAPLDQHIRFMSDVVSSCDNALKSYLRDGVLQAEPENDDESVEKV